MRTSNIVPAGSVTASGWAAGAGAGAVVGAAVAAPELVKVSAMICEVSMTCVPALVLKRTVAAVPPTYLPLWTWPFLSSSTSA